MVCKTLYRENGWAVYICIDKNGNIERRGLGFVPLNEKFPKSEAHHLDKELVIYIPERLHRTNSHNVWTGVGMNDINLKAFSFFLWKLMLSSGYD